jgi:hypothetical protein
VTYIDDLGRELRLHGIRGQTRCRILAEAIDHLREDPGAQERFGSAREVANAFAAELGAESSRRAAVSAFGRSASRAPSTQLRSSLSSSRIGRARCSIRRSARSRSRS